MRIATAPIASAITRLATRTPARPAIAAGIEYTAVHSGRPQTFAK
jgi:hypothetical protein